jgi:putative redox protein
MLIVNHYFCSKILKTMILTLTSTHGEKNFKGTNTRNQSIQLSGSDQAVGPMESVAMALAGCSAIDVELILGKMRQDFTSIDVEIETERAADEIPAVFTKIHLHFIVAGRDLKVDKVAQSVQMSIDTYCSVAKMLRATVPITYSTEVIEIAPK